MIASEEGRRYSPLGWRGAGTPPASTGSGSVLRAAGIGRISFSPVGEEARVARFLTDGLLDMFDPSLAGRPERTLGLGSDVPAGPPSHSPGRDWFASTPRARSDPWIRTAAAAAEPSAGV